MSPFINAVKTKIFEIIKEVKNIQGDAFLRFAFVGYKDHCDGADRVVRADFVEKIPGSPFELTVAQVQASGGGDGPEDIAGGLEEATQCSWRSSTRLLIHFADAPCHGNQYHNGMVDDYPAGDPRGLIPEQLLHILINKRVDYYFMRINSSTQTMVQKFEAEYKATGKNFAIHPVDSNAKDFVPKVVNSISSSMARSFARK